MRIKIKTDSELTQLLKLVDKNIIKIVITLFNIIYKARERTGI